MGHSRSRTNDATRRRPGGLIRAVALFAILVPVLSGCSPSPEEARNKLRELGRNMEPGHFVGSVRHEQTDIVELYLIAGMNPNVRIDRGTTALIAAARRGYLALAERLLKAGADPDIATIDQRTPLMYAARAGHAEVVRALIEAEADLNARDDTGRTALGYARKLGHDQIAALIEAHGGIR